MKIVKLILLVTLLAFSSCEKSKTLPDTNFRTVLIYLGSDNDLYQEADEKIEALRAGYAEGMGRLLIYCDAMGKTPQLLEITASEIPHSGMVKVLKNYEKENSASTAVVHRVLEDVKTTAPSSSYGIILFSHASGWLPDGMLLKPASVAQDRNDALELIDFAAAIPDGFFDFMIFESCFMSGIEVAYELRNKTGYILASSAEILSPGFTPIYSDLLPLLYKPEADLKGFGEVFYNHYNSLDGVYRSATVSLVKTSSLSLLAQWIKQNASVKSLPTNTIKEIQHYDRYTYYSLFFDFGQYYKKFIPDEKQMAFTGLLNDAVVYKNSTPSFMLPYAGFEIKHFSGMTTYIPQQEFSVLNEQYKQLQWVKDSSP